MKDSNYFYKQIPLTCSINNIHAVGVWRFVSIFCSLRINSSLLRNRLTVKAIEPCYVAKIIANGGVGMDMQAVDYGLLPGTPLGRNQDNFSPYARHIYPSRNSNPVLPEHNYRALPLHQYARCPN
jgi:hypothetical protein